MRSSSGASGQSLPVRPENENAGNEARPLWAELVGAGPSLMSWAVKVQKCSSDWKTPSNVSPASRWAGLVCGGRG